MADNYIPQVDYTSRDFAAIRQDLIDLIPFYAPLWTNRDPADFGMVLIEAFAYVGDLLNYYIDRAANEAFIGTASQRASLLKIAALLGYNPTQSTASTATLTFQNATANTITVPAYTKVATTTITNGVSSQILFETDSTITVPAKVGSTNGTATVTCTQGESKGYGFDQDDGVIGVSNGGINQTFPLPYYPVINDSIDITKMSFMEFMYLMTQDRKSTRLNSSHTDISRMPSSA